LALLARLLLSVTRARASGSGYREEEDKGKGRRVLGLGGTWASLPAAATSLPPRHAEKAAINTVHELLSVYRIEDRDLEAKTGGQTTLLLAETTA